MWNLLKLFSSACPWCSVGLELGEFHSEFGTESLFPLVIHCCCVGVWVEKSLLWKNQLDCVWRWQRSMLRSWVELWELLWREEGAPAWLIWFQLPVYFHVFMANTEAEVASISNNRLLSSLWLSVSPGVGVSKFVIERIIFYAVTVSRFCSCTSEVKT